LEKSETPQTEWLAGFRSFSANAGTAADLMLAGWLELTQEGLDSIYAVQLLEGRNICLTLK
jgi:hypothetical protein